MNPNQQTENPIAVTHAMVDIAYSFSTDTANRNSMHQPYIFLDIIFMHPRTLQVVNMRTTVSAHLLCQSKDVVEAAVHNAIRNALSFPGTHHMQEDLATPVLHTAHRYNYA